MTTVDLAATKMVPSLLNVLFRNAVKVAKVIAFDELQKIWSKIKNHPPADNSRIGDDAEKVPCDDKLRARMKRFLPMQPDNEYLE
ncbi:hypothetical protein DAPPUDRAFT_243259 [Daphnia pulex]|uniref:Uncharacterized protein n=1 Tax=Daphnia pulex TaxID=6669 RepID=E9GIC6_DAPPU|nr:hypothetical protein DAPPUDRAFT_243259 [Daphnia pulex]|eukprot:EFX80794.1 hypothetical protein DAPPUDRAFT_243259 [Daphnia pulex]